MSIDFSPERWEQVKETYRQWWAGELERPIIPVVLLGARDPGRSQPNAPFLSQVNCHDLSIPAADVIDRIDYELASVKFLGDAFPYFNMDVFGPGVIAAYLGGRLDNSSGRVWFYPPDDNLAIQDIHFKFDPENVWFKRTKELYQAAVDRWDGQVLMGMTDIGGNMDILSAFRPSEKLLMDLYDHPDEVKRLLWEAHEAWHQYYNALNAVLQPVNPGYSDWSTIYSEQPSYMLQSDFSYMISPKMFDQFVKPELAATCKRLPLSFYHLDGVGQIPHLDSLLEIEELDGIQWVPGDGKPDCAHWPELYRKIHAAGKKMQVFYGGLDAVDAVIEQIGTSRGIHLWNLYLPANEETTIRAKLQSYGIES
jgi:5-methyltetrahydrofolate--homocysteine methyltransferase